MFLGRLRNSRQFEGGNARIEGLRMKLKIRKPRMDELWAAAAAKLHCIDDCREVENLLCVA